VAFSHALRRVVGRQNHTTRRDRAMSSAMSGAWIRELRKRLGLSQVELAALLGTSNVTVNRWENDRASPQPAAIQRLREVELGGAASRASPAPTRVGNLPASYAPVIGRARDLDAVVVAVEQHPLVTIDGPAGTGKTTLALEVGRTIRHQWSAGAWFIDLAVALEPDDVAHAVARELAIRETGRKPLLERIAAEFATREILLILDNCELLVAACAQLVSEVMRIPSRSRILATSRKLLSVPGEHVYALRPLAATDAAALFLSQVREHQPALVPDDEEWQAIADICRRLDCLHWRSNWRQRGRWCSRWSRSRAGSTSVSICCERHSRCRRDSGRWRRRLPGATTCSMSARPDSSGTSGRSLAGSICRRSSWLERAEGRSISSTG
jgi:DNA-binding transcriptional regulator YiaG